MSTIDDKLIEGAAGAARGLRIEPVDNWHPAWRKVLANVERHGRADRLQVDGDGWLSARQVLLVAFIGQHVAAHLCFSVSPAKTCIEAKLESHGIAPGFCGRGVESQLHRAAVERAESLRCEKLRRFRLGSKWC